MPSSNMRRLRPVLLLATVAALAGAAAAGRAALEPAASDSGRIRDPAWLPDGRLLRLVSLGQRLALADLYWLRLVQYVGETVLARQARWDALYPLANIVTDLDPRHGYAYQVAGSNLSGLAHRYAESDAILQKGMRNVPDRWTLPFYYGFNKYFYEDDFAEAAIHVRRAAELGKRPHLALLAANLSLLTDRGEEYRAAIGFLEESIRQADPDLRAQLEQRLVKVRTYETLSEVEKALAAFQAREGRRPSRLRELVERGFLPAPPQDPSGGRIEYDPASGEVRSSAVGPRAPLRMTHRESK
jgi:tetratricopeptide (TPR) repeat protein